MAIDKILVKTMVNNLREMISRIENMDITMEEVLEDKDIQDLIDRRMQVAIENCIDVATHLAAGLNLERRERASEVFELLGKHGVISEDITQKLSQASKFRNILVHEYAKVDYQLAYSDLEEKIKDLKTFGKEVLEFLEKQG